jgi:hypothetical protein
MTSFLAVEPHGLTTVKRHIAYVAMQDFLEVDSFEMLATSVFSGERLLA